MPSLSRPRSNRIVAGVCAGIANRLGVSATLVRALFLLSMLLPGPQIIIYLVCWALMPNE